MKKQMLFLLALFFCTKLFPQVVIKSYTKENISSKGLFGKIETIPETTIAAIQSGNKINSPRANDMYKFAEPKFVDISPLLLASKEVVGDDVIYRQKFIGQNASTITISFDVLKLSKKAELYIYNLDGTVITGPITANENIDKGRFWSTNSFQGNSIIPTRRRIPSIRVRNLYWEIPSETKPTAGTTVFFSMCKDFPSCV